jgi:hypothetical protein
MQQLVKLIKIGVTKQLRGHQRGRPFINIHFTYTLSFSAKFQAKGEEKILVLLTYHNPIGMVLIGGDLIKCN